MAAKHDRPREGFDEVTRRLDQIVSDVRSKDTSLERSLDLFDEAISLGSKAVELVDRTDFSAAEKERLADLSSKDLVSAQEGAAGELAASLLQQEAATNEGMAVPGRPEGENSAQAAVDRAIDDADDGGWADGPREA